MSDEAKPRTLRLTDAEMELIAKAAEKQATAGERGGWSAWARRILLRSARAVVSSKDGRS